MTPFALETRIQDVLDGVASDEQRAALELEMADNPEARRIYLDYIYMGMALEFAEAELCPSTVGNVISMDAVIERRNRKSLRLAMYAAMAIVFLGVASLVYVIIPQQPIARFSIAPATQFALTHLALEGRKAPEGNALAVGSRVKLTKGMLELEFASGVRGIVRAPADFTLRKESLIDLDFGTVWFEVSEEAIGFQVETADLLLTDLGTEFGIVSKPDIPDEVHVFNGRVRVENRRGTAKSVELVTHDACVADETGNLEQIAFHSDHFFEKLPREDLLPSHRHWDFDSPRTGEMELEIANPGEGPVRVEGRVGDAVAFDEEGDGLVSRWPGISGNKPRTVAFWLKLPTDTPHYDETLVTWGRRSSSGSHSSTEWSVRATNYDYHNPAAIRTQWTDSAKLHLYFGGGWTIGSAELTRGEWHHVAVSYGGKQDARGRPRITFYVDGKIDRSRTYFSTSHQGPPIDTDVDSSDSVPLTVGRSRSTPSNSCNAAIDELYIFDHDLPYDSIRILANP